MELELSAHLFAYSFVYYLFVDVIFFDGAFLFVIGPTFEHYCLHGIYHRWHLRLTNSINMKFEACDTNKQTQQSNRKTPMVNFMHHIAYRASERLR